MANDCFATCTNCARSANTRPAFIGRHIRRRTFSHVIGWRHVCSAAGLDPEIDGIGNVLGRARGDGPKLLLGSHVETQPHAGWLDGALGVLYGLEVARTLGGGIDVAAWADEEGHFGSFIGSRSFCGMLTDAEIDTLHNREGTTLRDALAQAGFADRPRAMVDPARYRGYMEAHIEQGAELEDTGKRIGIVTAIVGSHRFRILFEGVQNHAGTTRMSIRKDAGVALVNLAHAIYQRFPLWWARARCGPPDASRWTRARRASCQVAPRWYSSSATPIPHCWRSWMASWRRWWPMRTAARAR